jgi:thiamine-monophosphate kinase
VNERELVARARELFSPGIGDDAAVVGQQVFTADMLVEDVDFTQSIAPRFIARKALAVNLSDLAAMGATPKYALLSLAMPEWALRHAQEFLESFASAAKQYRIEIVGGDFSRADKLTIAITAVGEIGKRPLLRSGAKRGDRVYLSRPIGGSATGLALMQKDVASYAEREFVESAIRRQIDPEPEVALGIALAAIDKVTACIDVSDGLSTDIHNLCDASNCGAEIERERIPIFPDLLTLGPKLGIKVSDAVLHGGEEFALLFTSSLTESQLSTMVKRPVYAIGRITPERGVILKENGVARPLEARGFDHFG